MADERDIGIKDDPLHYHAFPRPGKLEVRATKPLANGRDLSLAYSPLWIENMSAGRGWIALALVVFATWRPWRVFIGAYLFGGITILQLHAQALGAGVPAQVMSMLPYLATVIVLVLISRDQNKIKLNAPACIGQPFHPTA